MKTEYINNDDIIIDTIKKLNKEQVIEVIQANMPKLEYPDMYRLDLDNIEIKTTEYNDGYTGNKGKQYLVLIPKINTFINKIATKIMFRFFHENSKIIYV